MATTTTPLVGDIIKTMIPSFYEMLCDIAPEIPEDEYKVLVLHVYTDAEKTNRVLIPIQVRYTYNGYYKELLLDCVPIAEGVKIILNKDWNSSNSLYPMQQVEDFINKIIGRYIMDNITTDTTDIKAMQPDDVIYVCACQTNYCTQIRYVDNEFQINAWNYDSTLTTPTCLTCQKYLTL